MTYTCVMASTYPFGILKLVVSRHMTSTRVMAATCDMSSYTVYMCYVVIWRLHVYVMASTCVMSSICVMESTTLHYDVYYVLWQPHVLCHHIKSTCVTSGMSSYAVYMCYGVYHIVLWRLHMCYDVYTCIMTSTHVLWRLHMCYDHTCVTLFSVMVSSSMTTGVCESTKRETILC